ncbi:MAG: hypothetical protein QM477_11540 [Planctomycetota bacterium]
MKPFSIILSAILLATPAFAQHGEHEEHAADMAAKAKQQITVPTTLSPQTTCPISGEELEDKDNYVDYESHRIYLCCKKCKKKALANPEKAVFELYSQGVALENIQTTCPVSGEVLEDHDTFVKVYNKTIYTCCKKCAKKVKADPAKYLDIMEGRTAQEKCAVKGGDIDPEASFVIEGFSVGQCCSGCEKKWKADPAGYFAKLEKDKVVLEPASMKCPVMPSMNGSKEFPVTLGAKRYYLCSNKAAMMFVLNPDKYLPNWYKAQGIEMKMDTHKDDHAGGHDDGHGDHDH